MCARVLKAILLFLYMDEITDSHTSRKVYGYLAIICFLLCLFQFGHIFLQWGDIEEGGSQELMYLTMFVGILGTIFLILNRTD